MTTLPSASRLQLVDTCEASAVLPQVSTETPDASRGTAIHRYRQRAVELGSNEQALAEIEDDDLREVCAAIETDGLPVDPAAYSAEVALAYNVVTGGGRRLAGRERDYSDVTEDEIPGTADIVALVDDDAVYIGDIKTGYGRVPAPRRNLQLLFLALAACRAWGGTRAIVEIIRPRENARAWRERAEIGPFELAAVGHRLREMMLRVREARVQYELGNYEPRYAITEGCKYCPAIDHCRPMTEQLIEIATGPEERLEQVFLGSMRENAPAAHAKLKGIEAFVKRLRGHLETYATEHPFDIGDGYMYGLVETKRESLDGRATWNVIERRYGADAAWAATKLTATKEAVSALATREAQENKRKVKAGEAAKGLLVTVGTHINAELLGEIRKMDGGIKTKRTMNVKEFKRGVDDDGEGSGEE